MKKYFLLLIIAVLLSLSTTSVFAQTASQPKEKVLNSNEIIEKDYFSAGDSVVLHGTVNGDAYLAGGNVLVDGTVNGDIIAVGGQIIIEAKRVNNIRVFGGTVIISSKDVSGNITAAGGEVDILESAVIKGSIVAGAGNLRLEAPIGKGAHIAGGQVSILNSIDGDVFVGGGTIRLSQDAKINDNFTYWSKNKVELIDKNQVAGNIVQKTPPDTGKLENKSAVVFSSFKIVGSIIGFISLAIFGIILIYLLPNFTANAVKAANSKLWRNLGIGLLASILTPIAFIFLLITVIGIPFALILLFAYLLLAYFAKIFIAMAIGEKVSKFFKAKKLNTAWVFIIGLVVYSLVSFIPVIGGIFSFVAVLLGIGALLVVKRNYFVLLKNKKII